MGIVWAPVDEASRHRQRTVAKEAWRAARLALLGRLAGRPNASASRDAVLCLRSPRVRNGRRLRRGDLPYAPGGRDAARMGWWTRSRSPGAGPGQGVRRQERLTMTAQEARTRHAGVRFLCFGFFIGFIGFARSSATMLAGTRLPTTRLWSGVGRRFPLSAAVAYVALSMRC